MSVRRPALIDTEMSRRPSMADTVLCDELERSHKQAAAGLECIWQRAEAQSVRGKALEHGREAVGGQLGPDEPSAIPVPRPGPRRRREDGAVDARLRSPPRLAL